MYRSNEPHPDHVVAMAGHSHPGQPLIADLEDLRAVQSICQSDFIRLAVRQKMRGR